MQNVCQLIQLRRIIGKKILLITAAIVEEVKFNGFFAHGQRFFLLT